jgi:CRP-like cAMP-binding protein
MAQAGPVLTAGSELMAAHVAAIERCLSALDVAFAAGQSEQIDLQSQLLQRSLAESLAVFRRAEHAGVACLTPELAARLQLAQSRVTAQQAAVHRARGSIERTLAVLLPSQDTATYSGLAQSPAAKALNAYR